MIPDFSAIPMTMTVSELNEYVKMSLEANPVFGDIFIKGEISNFTNHYKTGHFYFTVKDENSSLKAVMFRTYTSRLAFKPENGMKVIIHGRITAFVRDGQYQLYADSMEPDGVGALYIAFEQLKAKLSAEGLFSPERKRPIPKIPTRVGIITAPTGAAIRDMINISGRRFPMAELVLFPSLVQGADAPEQLVSGLHYFSETGSVDVVIIGRGGGSIEDLWAFNEEKVAQAVFDCPVPVISAVGHETDTTIIDYVADLRAPTPSAAAELAVYDVHALEERLVSVKATLTRQIMRKLQMEKAMLQTIGVRLKGSSPIGKIRDRRTLAIQLEEHLQHAMEGRLQRDRHRLALYIEQLRGLSPLDKLNQGYSYVADAKGRTVTDVNRVKEGDRLTVYVKNGRIDAAVTDVCPMEYQ